MTGLVNEVLSRLSFTDKAKLLVEGGFSALRLDHAGMLGTCVDAELKGYLNTKPNNAILQSVLLHEVITDLCLGLQETTMLDLFAQHIRDSYNAKPGFVTYNLARFVREFQEAGISLKDVVIMTPFNSIGYQMCSSRDYCEATLSNMREGHVIAMSVMAGGYLKLDNAIDYIRSLPNLYGVAIGVSSKEHARDTFTKFRNMLEGLSVRPAFKSTKPANGEQHEH
jgi:hypothetical protein